MTQRAFEWETRSPTKGERAICGIWLLAFGLAMSNHYAGWELFRGFDKWVFFGSLLGGLGLIARMPRVRRVEGVRRPLSYWLIIGIAMIAAIFLSLP